MISRKSWHAWPYILYPILLIGLLVPFTASASKVHSIKISVEVGKEYSRYVRFGLLPVKVTPQLAVWLADSKGRYVGTLYVTSKSSGKGGMNRKAALPIWTHGRIGATFPDPLDAVTGPTSKASFEWECVIPKGVKSGKYTVMAEVNRSFDYNGSFKDNLPKANPFHNTDKSGQPSLLWKGTIHPSEPGFTVRLKKVGTGNPTGDDGFTYGLEGMTTALAIIKSITVTIH